MRVFKTKEFKRFARKEKISDDELCAAIARATRGIMDANLGRGLIKQCIPRKGQGRSGGFRTIIAFQHGNRSFFVYGFAKNEMDNIADDDLNDVASYAAALMGLTDKLIAAALKAKNRGGDVRCLGNTGARSQALCIVRWLICTRSAPWTSRPCVSLTVAA